MSSWTYAIPDFDTEAVTSQGSQVQVASGSVAAIDTGTTLVGGPADVVAQIFAQIPGSERGSGNYDGYYLYRSFLRRAQP